MIATRDHMVIALAAAQFKYPAIRINRALAEVGYGETRFWQRVGWLLERPEVEAAYPTWVKRERRLRAARRAQRSMVRS